MRSLVLLVSALALAHATTVTVSWGLVNTTSNWNPIFINAGDSVTFSLSLDSMAHTVTSNYVPSSSSFNSGQIANGGTYTHAFTNKGYYSLKCAYHSSMFAEVYVGST